MTEQLGLNAADVALIVGMVQCGLIAWGISEMRGSNKSREATNQMMIQQTKALERLLERTE